MNLDLINASTVKLLFMKVVNDPFGNEIKVPLLALELKNNLSSGEVFADVDTVIERAMLFYEIKGIVTIDIISGPSDGKRS